MVSVVVDAIVSVYGFESCTTTSLARFCSSFVRDHVSL